MRTMAAKTSMLLETFKSVMHMAVFEAANQDERER